MTEPTVLSRRQLYDLVWATPISPLAERFGISDRGLAKICERHREPSPSRGYWASVEAGQKPILRTMVVHRAARLAEILGKETAVICGSQRGNTSIVGYAVYNLGYFLGERTGSLNYEDTDVLSLMPEPAL